MLSPVVLLVGMGSSPVQSSPVQSKGVRGEEVVEWDVGRQRGEVDDVFLRVLTAGHGPMLRVLLIWWLLLGFMKYQVRARSRLRPNNATV